MSRTVRRRKIDWRATAKRRAAPACPPVASEPPRFLGTWSWRNPAMGEDATAWNERIRRQRAHLVAQAANWLRPGQPVRVLHDPRIAGESVEGRTGSIFRLCSATFDDHVYVVFPPVGRQRVERVRMLPIERLQPAG